MFDGLAMVAKWSIRDGAVHGSQRFIETQQYKYVHGSQYVQAYYRPSAMGSVPVAGLFGLCHIM
jgi:carotenoid cleavage dioxygenase-like enzyme